MKRKRRAKVLGPISSRENSRESLQEMHFAVEVDCAVQIIPYKKIKSEYKDELIEYFEKRAKPCMDDDKDS